MESKIDVESLAKNAIKDEKLLSELLEGILSKNDETRFNSYQLLMHISEECPEVLYPKWDYFQTKITNKLLNIDKTHRGKQTDLMKAYAIEAFNEYFEEASDKEKILDFVKAQLESKSPKTRKVAKEFF